MCQQLYEKNSQSANTSVQIVHWSLSIFLSVCLSVNGVQIPTSHQPILNLSTQQESLGQLLGYKVGWEAIRSKLQKFVMLVNTSKSANISGQIVHLSLSVFLSVRLSVSGAQKPSSHQPILNLSTCLEFLSQLPCNKIDLKSFRSKLQQSQWWSKPIFHQSNLNLSTYLEPLSQLLGNKAGLEAFRSKLQSFVIRVAQNFNYEKFL